MHQKSAHINILLFFVAKSIRFQWLFTNWGELSRLIAKRDIAKCHRVHKVCRREPPVFYDPASRSFSLLAYVIISRKARKLDVRHRRTEIGLANYLLGLPGGIEFIRRITHNAATFPLDYTDSATQNARATNTLRDPMILSCLSGGRELKTTTERCIRAPRLPYKTTVIPIPKSPRYRKLHPRDARNGTD